MGHRFVLSVAVFAWAVSNSQAALPANDHPYDASGYAGGIPDTLTPHKEKPHDPYLPTAIPPVGYVPRAAEPIRSGPFVSVQVNVSAVGANIPGDAANEPSLAVSPLNPDIIAIGWRQFDNVGSNFRQAGWGYSQDGGASWTFPGRIDPGVFRSDPVLQADSNGNFYYYSLTGDFLCDMFKSTNGGVSWNAGTAAFGGDKAWFTIDRTGGQGNNHIYIAWSRAAACCGSNTFTRSINGGASYMNPIFIPNTPTFGTLDVGPDGELYIGGVNAPSFTNPNFVVSKSTNARNPLQTPTFTLSTGVNLGGALRGSAGPNPGGLLGQVNLACDRSTRPTRGNVYLLCSVDPPGDDPLDIHFARSTNGGSSWSAPVRVNDDAFDSNAWQWFGTMSVAPNGRLDAVWNDTRNDPSGAYSRLYYSYSGDAGVHWSPNQPLTPRWNSLIGHPNQNKIGDYYDMISDDDGFFLAYSATFNGEQDVYFMRGVVDCNTNGVPDHLDVAGGTSQDCTGDLRPDECEPDCNANGIADVCDLAFGTNADCTANGTPDECEPDCNANGMSDVCDLAAGTSLDCNSDRVPDECQLGPGDCNSNGIPDDCDLAAETSEDCTLNGTPDECEPDCNANGRADSCDIALPVGSDDCNLNGVPDECETILLDCNSNGLPDDCDIAAGPNYDCDGNGTPDDCDLAAGTLADANGNGIPDACEVENCYTLWGGFESAPFALGAPVDGIDTDGDGDAWINETATATVGAQGCPGGQGRSLKVVAQNPPSPDSVTSEFFRTSAGRLDCGASKWSVSFDVRSEAQLNPRIDWQLSLRDGKNDRDVMLIHWASTQSQFNGIGASGRGRIHVLNPAGSPVFLSTGFAIPTNTCYTLDVTLDNLSGVVELYINDQLRVTTTRLDAGANRIDYFLLEQLPNGQSTGGTHRLALDNFRLCETGAALPWPDCDGNCVSDLIETASGAAPDCNGNSVPDVCESLADCNDNGLRDLCETADGLAPDCNANGVPDFCDVLGHDCCETGHGTGCSNAGIETCVCAVDPYCCAVEWDAICASEVAAEGCGGCGLDSALSDCNHNGQPDDCDNCADADADGDADVVDTLAFIDCLTGPGVPAATACRCVLDADADVDLDLRDFAGFQACFRSP